MVQAMQNLRRMLRDPIQEVPRAVEIRLASKCEKALTKASATKQQFQ
jgi:hypothetical protein